MKDKILKYLEKHYAESSNERYVKYLTRKGISIGKNCIFRDPKSTTIDLTRPSLIEIGDNVDMNVNFTILTHDYATLVFRNMYHEFIPSSGKVKIGNNIYIGRNVSILKGVTIGDNCVIGIGSIVTRDIPANSVAVGAPAKVIYSVEKYYEIRKAAQVNEAFLYAKSIKERYGRMPVIEDFWEEFPLFLNGNEDHQNLPVKKQLKSAYEIYKVSHKAIFNGFDDFLTKAGLFKQ